MSAGQVANEPDLHHLRNIFWLLLLFFLQKSNQLPGLKTCGKTKSSVGSLVWVLCGKTPPKKKPSKKKRWCTNLFLLRKVHESNDFSFCFQVFLISSIQSVSSKSELVRAMLNNNIVGFFVMNTHVNLVCELLSEQVDSLDNHRVGKCL